jgi:hypothetical protein
MFYAIHLRAPNDANGNPRRCFAIYAESGEYLGTVDEGYKGDRAIGASGLIPEGATVRILGRFDTTPSQRRELLKGRELAKA